MKICLALATLVTSWITLSFSALLDDGSFKSFPVCHANRNSPCSATNTFRMVSEVAEQLAVDAAGTLAAVENKEFNRAQGFFPIVLNATTLEWMASGFFDNNSAKGKSIDTVLGSLVLVEQFGAGAYLSDLATSADGWGELLWPAFNEGMENKREKQGSTHVVFARRDSTGNHIVFGLFQQKRLERDQICDTSHNMPCTFSNVRAFLGAGTSQALRARTPTELWKVFNDITYQESFRSNDWYIFAYKFGPGTRGECVAHGLNANLIGKNITEVLRDVNLDPRVGENLHRSFVEAVGHGGGWVSYDWVLPNVEGVFEKVSFVQGFEKFGTTYYFGVGITNLKQPELRDHQCEFCSSAVAQPCAKATVEATLSHVQVALLTDSEQAGFEKITQGEEYRLVPTQEGESGYFSVVFHQDQTCVAYSGRPELVGLTIEAVFAANGMASIGDQALELHERFLLAAKEGGRWIRLSLKDGTNLAAYVIPVGEVHYGLVWISSTSLVGDDASEVSSSDCNAAFSGLCSEKQAVSLVGENVMAIITAETSKELTTAFEKINSEGKNRNGHFAIVIDAESGEIVAHGNLALQKQSFIDLFQFQAWEWTQELGVSVYNNSFHISEEELGILLELGTKYGGSTFAVEVDGNLGGKRKGFVMDAHFDLGKETQRRYLVLSSFVDAPVPSRCGSCPEGSTCDEEQGLCLCRSYFVTQFEQSSSEMVGSCQRSIEPEMSCLPNEESSSLKTVKSIAYVFSAMNMIVCIALIVWTVLWRQNPIIQASQMPFLLVLCGGGLLASLAIPLLALDDEGGLPAGLDADNDLANIGCMSGIWFYSLGMVLISSSLIVKLYRVRVVFLDSGVQASARGRPLKAPKITTRDLMLHILAFVMFDVVLLTIWSLLHPLQFIRTSPSEASCDGEYFSVYGAILGCYHLGLLGYGVRLAYATRKVNTVFSEAKFLGIAIFSVFQILLINIPLLLLVRESQASNIFIMSALIWITVLTVLLLIFVPKIIYIYKGASSSGLGGFIVAEFSSGSGKTKKPKKSRNKVSLDNGGASEEVGTDSMLGFNTGFDGLSSIHLDSEYSETEDDHTKRPSSNWASLPPSDKDAWIHRAV